MRRSSPAPRYRRQTNAFSTTKPPPPEEQRTAERLVRVGVALSSELDLERLVQKLTDEATALCGAEFGAFFYNVVTDERQGYSLFTLSGADRATAERLAAPHKTPLFTPTYEGRGVVRLDDVMDDPRYGLDGPHYGMPDGHFSVRSYLAIPVTSRTGEVFGGLLFGHSRPGMFTEHHEELLLAVSAQAGVAIDNARLFDALRRAEVQAEVERNKLRRLLMQSPAGVLVLRGAEHAFEFANDSARWMLLRADAGATDAERVAAFVEENRATLDDVYRSGQRQASAPVDAVTGALDASAPSERFVSVTYEPYFGPQDRVEGIMCVAFEVTEEVLAKRRSDSFVEELERASRHKDDILAVVSHELRSPLNAILGWTQMLRTQQLDSRMAERALETIERNARAQTQLVEDLLDVSRIVMGKLALDMQDVDLQTVIRDAIEVVRPSATKKRLTILPKIEDGALSVIGDPDRLRQVVVNLLSNAVRFSEDGGTVRIDAQRTVAGIEIVVADEGQGITAHFLPHVFERFRQANAREQRPHGGLGLGLSIVRQLVELHGGSVTAASDGPGKGAVFTVTIPVTTSAVPKSK